MAKKLFLVIALAATLGVAAWFVFKMPKDGANSQDTLALETKNSEETTASKKPLALVHSAPLSSDATVGKPGQEELKQLPPLGPNASKPELVTRLIQMQKADFDNVRNFVTSSMQELTAQMAEDDGDGENPEEQQAMLGKINKVTQEALDYIEKKIEATYSERFTAAELQELIELQQDPVYRTVKDSTVMQDYQDFKQDYKQFIDSLPDNPPTPQREKIVRSIVDNSNIREVFEKINSSLGSYAPPPGSGSAEDKAAQDAAFDQQIKELHDQSYQGLLFALREINDDQLVHYNGILQTDVMKKGQKIQKELIPDLMDRSFKSVMGVVDES